jgi:hypothetical protein
MPQKCIRLPHAAPASLHHETGRSRKSLNRVGRLCEIEMRDFLPAGSYRLQARDVRATLYCKARKRNGIWIPASIDLTHLDETNIANEDGHLVNLQGDAGRVGFKPHGSYLKSIDELQVILSALCLRNDQRWQWSTLDITDLDYHRAISLVDGVLTTDPFSTN